MRNPTISTFLLITFLTVSLSVYSQTYRNGHMYYAMPMPEQASSFVKTKSSAALSYEISKGRAQLLGTSDYGLGETIPLSKEISIDYTDSGLSRAASCSLTSPGDSEKYPHCAVVKLFIRFGASYSVASGVIIGSRYVLTAGHCVYEPGYGWADEIEVVPAYNDDSAPFGSARAVSFLSWTGWTEQRSFDSDLGVIVLDKNMGECTGSFGFGAQPDDAFFLNQELRGLSYPAANGWNGKYLQFWHGTLSGVNGNIVRLNCQAIGGSSGGALYYKNDNGDRYVYGVYSHGNSDYTGFARLTSSMYYDIKNLMAQWGTGAPCR